MRTKYYLTSIHYNATHKQDKSKVATFYSMFFSINTEKDHCGLPTQESMRKYIDKFLADKDYEFIEGTIAILSVMKLTKEQFICLGGTC